MNLVCDICGKAVYLFGRVGKKTKVLCERCADKLDKKPS